MKKTFFLFAGICLIVAYASSAVAAVSLKRLAEHPFSQPMPSVEDLRNMIRDNREDLQTGLNKAGYEHIYSDFMNRFPDAEIDTIRIAPGERFVWMLFRNKYNGKIKVLQNVIWEGDHSFEAYRFYIDSADTRYEFIVPAVCGNVTLRNIGPVPAAAPMSGVSEPVPEPAPQTTEEPAAGPVVQKRGGPLFDFGLAQQFDPASYVFARIGYELPLAERISATGLIGGFIRFEGDDGGDAFTADAMLNFALTEKMFVGAGAGFWSDEEEIDLIVNAGYLVYEKPDAFRTSLFIEGRSQADDLISSEASRLGLGLRFEF